MKVENIIKSRKLWSQPRKFKGEGKETERERQTDRQAERSETDRQSEEGERD